MGREQRSVWRFKDFEVDEALCELRRGGRRVPLQRKPYQLLVYLVANRHRVVSRDDLLEVVWQGVAVSDSALASALRDLRRALSDAGRSPWAIETVHGFGYRFIAKIDERPAEPTGEDPASHEWDERSRWALARQVVELLESVQLSGQRPQPSS